MIPMDSHWNYMKFKKSEVVTKNKNGKKRKAGIQT